MKKSILFFDKILSFFNGIIKSFIKLSSIGEPSTS